MRKITAKEIMKRDHVGRVKAKRIADAANRIIQATEGLTCCQIRRVLVWAKDYAADPCTR